MELRGYAIVRGEQSDDRPIREHSFAGDAGPSVSGLGHAGFGGL
jgi:hypothetical protein